MGYAKVRERFYRTGRKLPEAGSPFLHCAWPVALGQRLAGGCAAGNTRSTPPSFSNGVGEKMRRDEKTPHRDESIVVVML